MKRIPLTDEQIEVLAVGVMKADMKAKSEFWRGIGKCFEKEEKVKRKCSVCGKEKADNQFKYDGIQICKKCYPKPLKKGV